MVRYALYRRVSSVMQVEDGASLESQFSMAEAFVASQKDGNIVSDYCDAGVSATHVPMHKRTELMRMLEDARRARFDVLLVFKRDRLARNDEETVLIRVKLRQANIRVHYLSPNEPAVIDGPYGEFMESIIASVASLEPKLLAERVRAVKRELRNSGLWVGGVPRYGHVVDTESKRLMIVEDEARVIKTIYNDYVHHGMGYLRIARKLNAQGIKYRTHRNKLVEWTETTVRKLIIDPKNCGYLVLDEHESFGPGAVPIKALETPIIGLQQFRKAQELRAMRDRRVISPRNVTTSFLLTGLIFCSCGYRMRGINRSSWKSTSEGKKLYSYQNYSCNGRASGMGTCQQHPVKLEVVHDLVLRKCFEELHPRNVTLLLESLKKIRAEQLDEATRDLRQTAHQISATNRRISATHELLENTEMPSLTVRYEARLVNLDAELKRYQQHFSKVKGFISDVTNRVWNENQILERLTSWEDTFKDASFEMKRAMLLDIVDRIEITKEGGLRIILKYDLSLVSSAGFLQVQ